MRGRTYLLFVVGFALSTSVAHSKGLTVNATDKIVEIRNETKFTIEGVR